MVMRIAGHTLGTPDQTLPEALALFRAAGLSAAEVNYVDDYRPALPTDDLDAARDAARIARDLGVDVVALTPYTTSINSPDHVHRRAGVDELDGCLRAAEVLGAHVMRVYAGSWHDGDADLDGAWNALVESLRTLAPMARDRGVVMCVENHFGTMTQSAAASVRLVDEVDDPAVRILYDQANLTFTHDESPAEALEIQRGHVAHVHVKDLVFTDPDKTFVAAETARVSSEERAVRSRVVGSGVIPWRDILVELTRQGYDGVLSLEYEYRWHRDDLIPPELGFAQSARYLADLLDSFDSSAEA